MSLKQKPVVEAVPEMSDGAVGDVRGSRWLGILFVGLGALFLLLAAGDVLAATTLGGGKDDAMRATATGTGEHLAGIAGADVIHGGRLNDSLIGGAGDDEVYGGAGQDFLLGGAGADLTEAADGARDLIGCGAGANVVSADVEDLVASDCETVYAN